MYQYLPNPVEFLHPKLNQAKRALGFQYLTLKEWWAAGPVERKEIEEALFLAVLDDLVTDSERKFLVGRLKNYYFEHQLQFYLFGARYYKNCISSILEICSKSLASSSKDTRIHAYHHLFQLRDITARTRQNLEWLLEDANSWLRSTCTEHLYLPNFPDVLNMALNIATDKSGNVELFARDFIILPGFTRNQRNKIKTIKAFDLEMTQALKVETLRYLDSVENELKTNPYLHGQIKFHKRVKRLVSKVRYGLHSKNANLRMRSYQSLFKSIGTTANSDTLEFVIELANSLIQEKLFSIQERDKNVTYANA